MKTRDITIIAPCVACICLSAWLAVPIGGVMITMQTAMICLIAGVFGAKRAGIAVVAYLIIGGIGLPVFAGFGGGISRLVSPMGGFLIGFLLLAVVVGWTSDKSKHKAKNGCRLVIGVLIGMALCYAMGMAWFACLALQEGGVVNVSILFLSCVLPYLPFDVVKLALAIYLIRRMRQILPLSFWDR